MNECNELYSAIVQTIDANEDCFKRRLALVVCDLYQKWEDHKQDTAPQKFYLGLSALKQMMAIAKELKLLSTDTNPKTPNSFELFLRNRDSTNNN